jgi:hypothetical protein
MSGSSTTTSVCQSCASVLKRSEDLGSDERGLPVTAYCRRCYRGGAWIEPDLTRDEMVRRIATALRTSGLAEHAAREQIEAAVAKLARWRDGGATPSPLDDLPTQRVPQLVVAKPSDRR